MYCLAFAYSLWKFQSVVAYKLVAYKKACCENEIDMKKQKQSLADVFQTGVRTGVTIFKNFLKSYRPEVNWM